MNYIVAPPLYLGSSFMDVVDSLSHLIKQHGLAVELIQGELLPNRTTDGLDDAQYLQGQLENIRLLGAVPDQSKILFLDFFNPGLDALLYHHSIRDIRVKFGALIHGSVFVHNDLYAWDWLRPYEAAWWQTYERVYAPFGFPKSHLPGPYQSKLKQAEWGLDGKKFPPPNAAKKYDVVFPHRLHPDKGVTQLLEIVTAMPEVSFLITCPQTHDYAVRNQYYVLLSALPNVAFAFAEPEPEHLRTLASCRVVLSCALQEHFGYAVLKAVYCGAVPVLPDRLCYPDMYGPQYLYGNTATAVSKIRHLLRENAPTNPMLTGEFSFYSILQDFFQ